MIKMANVSAPGAGLRRQTMASKTADTKKLVTNISVYGGKINIILAWLYLNYFHIP